MTEDVTKEIARTKPEFVTIENEAYRTYYFIRDGQEYQTTIYNPTKLNVKRGPKGDSHRLVDAAENSHYIPAGWHRLTWHGKIGESYDF